MSVMIHLTGVIGFEGAVTLVSDIAHSALKKRKQTCLVYNQISENDD